jgi:hypothetical protein
MPPTPTPHDQLLRMAQQCARAPHDDQLAAALAQRALEVAHDGRWESFDYALATAPEAERFCLMDAMEQVVECPVLADAAGQVWRGRLFAIPVSQLLDGEACLQALPQGATLERLLVEALCPGGKGMLVNRLLPDALMSALTYQQVWGLAHDALTATAGEYAGALETPYATHAAAGFVSALHFVPFVALVPEQQADALLALDEDELALRTLPVMDALSGVVNAQLDADAQDDIHVCLHLPQPLFYDIDVVNLGHETFLFSATVSAWEAAATDEGSTLALSVMLDRHAERAAVVIEARILGERAGQYRFEVDAHDPEMQAEVCASVDELARQRGLAVEFTGDAARLVGHAVPVVPQAFLMDAPRSLQ